MPLVESKTVKRCSLITEKPVFFRSVCNVHPTQGKVRSMSKPSSRQEPQRVAVILRKANEVLSHLRPSSCELTERSDHLGVQRDALAAQLVQVLVTDDELGSDDGWCERAKLRDLSHSPSRCLRSCGGWAYRRAGKGAGRRQWCCAHEGCW